jgi:cytochrome b6-f complex iron-sulfur subunit
MALKRKHLNRREFFSFLSVGWIAFSAATAGLASLVFRFLYPNVNFEPEMEFLAGKPESYEPGVDERWKAQHGVWIVKQEGILVAFSVICTHLGCVPNWLSGERKFKCPCHGSGFYMNGVNFEGPAPRPLERFKISLNAAGTIVVDKTKLYRQEKGQWSNPESFIEV